MNLLENLISDRGSKYSVSGGTVRSRSDIDAFLIELKRTKRYARATHNSWGAVLGDGGPAKGDDGEAGAGATILRLLQHAAVQDHVVVVTRWYGGVNLGGDRFRHVAEAVRAYLERFSDGGSTAGS